MLSVVRLSPWLLLVSGLLGMGCSLVRTPIVDEDARPPVDAGPDARRDTPMDVAEGDTPMLDVPMDVPGLDTPDVPFDADLDGGIDAGELDTGVDTGMPDTGVDVGMPDTGVDTGMPDAGMPDTGVDAGMPDTGVDSGPPTVRGCDAIYGSAPGYNLCDERATECEFYTGSGTARSCDAVCSTRGGATVVCYNNAFLTQCTRSGGAVGCGSDRFDQICICTRIP